VFVLTPDDWEQFAPMPAFGMPQAWSDRLVIAATPGGIWIDYIEAVDPMLDAAQRRQLQSTYGEPPELGGVFADLLVAHEVGHFFHVFDDTGETEFARPWIGELFANIALYGYVSDVEPDQLQVLETICEVSAAANVAAWSEHGIEAMGGGSVNGYVWFQFLLILVARQIWASAGGDARPYLRGAMRDPTMSDADIVTTIEQLDAQAAEAIRTWPHVHRH
jgi:hypothetical protein